MFELSLHAGRPMVALRMTELQASASVIGFTLSGVSLLPLLVGVPLGAWIDRVGAPRIMGIGCLLTAAGFFLLWNAEQVLTMAGAHTLALTGLTACIISSHWLATSVGPEHGRAQSVAWLTTAVTLSQLVAPPIAGLLADTFSIQTVFFWLIWISLAPLPLVPRLLSGDRAVMRDAALQDAGDVRPHAQPAVHNDHHKTTKASQLDWFSGFRLLRIRELKWVLLSTLLVIVAFDIRNSFFPIHLQALGMTKAEIGGMFTIFAVAGLTVRIALGWFSARAGAWKLLVLACLLGVPAFLLFSFTDAILWIIAATLLLGLTFGLTQPLNISIVADIAPPAQRGLAFGLRFAAVRLASVISPLVLGLSVSLAGTGAAFYVAGAAMALAALTGVVGMRASRHR